MKYDIYGIGNALVDQEFEVTDEFLQKNSIEKGMMSLIDQEQQEKLSAQLDSVFGIIKRAGGGSAANSMVAASQFGASTFYACKVANDETGKFYSQDLDEAGVKTRLDDFDLSGHTGKCIVMVTPDAERTMNTFLGITADFSADELHLEELKNSNYLYIEGYLVTSDISRAAVIEARKIAKQNNVKTAMTFSDPAMVTYFKDGILEMLGEGVDVLFCNQEECMTFTAKDNLDDAIREAMKFTNKLIVTLGSDGAMVVNKSGEPVTVPGSPVSAIDTNGAGDMFAGAFMYGITHGMTDEKAAQLANAAAAQIVTAYGARLANETHQELLSAHR